jgi:hypothetical protein
LALEPPQAVYERRRDLARDEAARFDTWSAWLGTGRVLVVLCAATWAVIAWTRGLPQPWGVWAGLGALFVISIVLQDWTDRRTDSARLRVILYERNLERLAGRWKSFPARGSRFDDAAHPYAQDLDLLGDGSLFQLLDTTRTTRGESTLARWLMAAAPIPEVMERRAALQALQPEIDARERLAIAGLDRELSRIDEDPLLAWAEGPELFAPGPAMLWAARILPILTIGTYLVSRTGLVPFWPIWFLVAGHVLIIGRTRPDAEKIGAVAEKTETMLKRLLPLFVASRTQPTSTPMLAHLVEQLTGAVEATTSLRRRIGVFQSRANFIVAVISPIVLWDVHAAVILQVWQRRYGRRMRGWFESLGEIEALAAMGTYAYEHGEDAWPEISEGSARFEASGLGHPLIDPGRCVRNDVVLMGPGTALLVTGSNMSGKSTLLRAVGLNAVLALSGLPVRAMSLRISRVQVATSMRVSDSLQEGASFFLAEVQRLKSVVDLAHGSIPVLFLLDEILQGTNTRERSLGARGVVAHLLEAGAFGLVSTHDLSLARLGDQFHDRIRYAHFTDQVEGDRMTFDYKLRSGVVQTSNALRLMRAVGLKVEIPEET